MSKNRIFKFTDGDEIKEVTALGWRRAVKSFQSSAKATETVVSWIVRGHHGKRWNYEPSEHYMGMGKKRSR